MTTLFLTQPCYNAKKTLADNIAPTFCHHQYSQGSVRDLLQFTVNNNRPDHLVFLHTISLLSYSVLPNPFIASNYPCGKNNDPWQELLVGLKQKSNSGIKAWTHNPNCCAGPGGGGVL